MLYADYDSRKLRSIDAERSISLIGTLSPDALLPDTSCALQYGDFIVRKG